MGSEDNLKLPPHSIEAEEAILGSIIIDPDIYYDIRGLVESGDFYREVNQFVFEAIDTLKDDCNEVTLANELSNKGRLEMVGGSAYLSELAYKCPTSIYASHYAKIVAQKAFERRIIRASGEIAALAYNSEGDSISLLTEAQAILNKLNPLDCELVNPKQHAESILNMINKAHINDYKGIYSGYEELDNMIGGFYPGNLVIIGARPGVGKSQILQEIALDNAYNRKTVLIASREMSLNEWDERHIQMETSVDIRRIRSGNFSDKEWGSIQDIAGMISDIPLYFLPGSFGVQSILQKARQMKKTVGLDLVIVDYIQLLSDRNNRKRGENLRERIGYISNSLKSLAMDMECPVIAASQLNRDVESRESKRPTMSDLKESGDLEQDADIILLLNRPEGEPNTLYIGINKVRQLGKKGYVKLKWGEETHRYYGEYN